MTDNEQRLNYESREQEKHRGHVDEMSTPDSLNRTFQVFSMARSGRLSSISPLCCLSPPSNRRPMFPDTLDG